MNNFWTQKAPWNGDNPFGLPSTLSDTDLANKCRPRGRQY